MLHAVDGMRSAWLKLWKPLRVGYRDTQSAFAPNVYMGSVGDVSCPQSGNLAAVIHTHTHHPFLLLILMRM